MAESKLEVILRHLEGREEIDVLDDGYKYYFPSTSLAHSAEDLRLIARILDEKNAEWHRQVLEQQRLDYLNSGLSRRFGAIFGAIEENGGE